MRISAIIPARMDSTRLPGKPLADIGGVPMIVHAWKAASAHPDIARACVATDHEEIATAVRKAGGEAVMTGTHHASGTERCAEAAVRWTGAEHDALLNLQGDEPFPDPASLSAICSALHSGKWEVVSIMRPAAPQEAGSAHRVKVVCGTHGNALFFSRSAIPHGGPHQIHLGIYGFAPGQLLRCAALPPGTLEKQEKLEQLRWIEHGLHMGMVNAVEGNSPGSVDTDEDLKRVRDWYTIHKEPLSDS